MWCMSTRTASCRISEGLRATLSTPSTPNSPSVSSFITGALVAAERDPKRLIRALANRALRAVVPGADLARMPLIATYDCASSITNSAAVAQALETLTQALGLTRSEVINLAAEAQLDAQGHPDWHLSPADRLEAARTLGLVDSTEA